MSRNFDLLKFTGTSGPGRWLRIAFVALALANVAAIYLYIAPPGGSRRQLMEQEKNLARSIQVHRITADRLKTVSQKVQLGGDQTAEFGQQYFLNNRAASGVLFGELLRISTAAQLKEGQRTISQEPIEGTDDLTLLTINSNYQGTYQNLMKFVNEVDHSNQLLILDTLTATPLQQGVGVLNITVRFLAVVKEEGNAPAGGTVGGQP